MHAAAQLSAYTAQDLSQGMVPPTMGRCFHLSLSKLNPHRHAKGPIFQGLSTFYNLTLPITEGEIRDEGKDSPFLLHSSLYPPGPTLKHEREGVHTGHTGCNKGYSRERITLHPG